MAAGIWPVHDICLLKKHQYAQKGNNDKKQINAFLPNCWWLPELLICMQLFPTICGKSCSLPGGWVLPGTNGRRHDSHWENSSRAWLFWDWACIRWLPVTQEKNARLLTLRSLKLICTSLLAPWSLQATQSHSSRLSHHCYCEMLGLPFSI